MVSTCVWVLGSFLAFQQTCNEHLLVLGQRVIKQLLSCLGLMCSPTLLHHTHMGYAPIQSYDLTGHPAIHMKHTRTHLQTNTPRCSQMWPYVYTGRDISVTEAASVQGPHLKLQAPFKSTELCLLMGGPHPHQS